MSAAIWELYGFTEPMSLSPDHKTVKMLIKINVTGSLPRRGLGSSRGTMYGRRCNDSRKSDMINYRVIKTTISDLEIEAARDSIEVNNFILEVVGEGSREGVPTVIREKESNDLDLVAAQIITDATISNEDRRMVEARNGIKGKAKASEGGLSSGGKLVIKEGVAVVDIDEAVRRMEAANEHQLQAGSLLDFTINIKEPERKRRKYKRRVPLVEEVAVKKAKGVQCGEADPTSAGVLATDVPSGQSLGDDSIILVNPQLGNEMVMVAPINSQ
ncbi:hypothetical protein C5167_022008, partial [Papaver somniferum]